jgi:sulfate permease
VLEGLTLIAALAFAVNIGASGAAATMSQVYGSGALTKRLALLAVALFVILGAYFSGSEVVQTIGKGLIVGKVLTLEAALVILLCALAPLFLANRLGVPLSTSEVTVGSVVGVALALGGLNTGKLGIILLSWTALPVVAFAIAAVLQKWGGGPLERRLNGAADVRFHRLLAFLLIAGGCYAAYSAGANNAANATGPLVGAGEMSVRTAVILGGLFMAVGALTLGGRVMETNARKITKLTVPAGIVVDVTSASLVLGLSYMGLPVPLTQATTGGIVGVSFARSGRRAFQRDVVKKVVSVWLISPAISLVLSFFLFNFLQGLQGQFVALAVVVVVTLVSVLGAVLLLGGRYGLKSVWQSLNGSVSALGVSNARDAHIDDSDIDAGRVASTTGDTRAANYLPVGQSYGNQDAISGGQQDRAPQASHRESFVSGRRA